MPEVAGSPSPGYVVVGRSCLAVVTAGAASPSSRQEPPCRRHGSSRLAVVTPAAGSPSSSHVPPHRRRVGLGFQTLAAMTRGGTKWRRGAGRRRRVARRSRAGGESRGGAQGQRRRAAAPEEEERRAAEEEKRRGFDLVRRRRSSLFWAKDADAWARGQGTQGGSKISAGWRLRFDLACDADAWARNHFFQTKI